jgi:hypothetical protein
VGAVSLFLILLFPSSLFAQSPLPLLSGPSVQSSTPSLPKKQVSKKAAPQKKAAGKPALQKKDDDYVKDIQDYFSSVRCIFAVFDSFILSLLPRGFSTSLGVGVFTLFRDKSNEIKIVLFFKNIGAKDDAASLSFLPSNILSSYNIKIVITSSCVVCSDHSGKVLSRIPVDCTPFFPIFFERKPLSRLNPRVTLEERCVSLTFLVPSAGTTMTITLSFSLYDNKNIENLLSLSFDDHQGSSALRFSPGTLRVNDEDKIPKEARD